MVDPGVSLHKKLFQRFYDGYAIVYKYSLNTSTLAIVANTCDRSSPHR